MTPYAEQYTIDPFRFDYKEIETASGYRERITKDKYIELLEKAVALLVAEKRDLATGFTEEAMHDAPKLTVINEAETNLTWFSINGNMFTYEPKPGDFSIKNDNSGYHNELR
jgi:hypothetical protein